MKKFISMYKALYPGELRKKTEYVIKRKINYFEKQSNNTLIPRDLKFLKNDINFDFLKDFKETEESFYYRYSIFEQEINLKNYIFNNSTKDTHWSKCNFNDFDDIKYEWEINRLQFLLPLTKKYMLEKNEDDLILIKKIIKNWTNENPFDYGINWYSNLEVGIRVTNLMFTYILLYNELQDLNLEEIIYLHGVHLFREISYSDKCIPNNHVVGEATSLLFICNFLKFKHCEKWEQVAIRYLKKYLNLLSDDGFSIEGSFNYQFFITKMYYLVFLLIQNNEEKIFLEELRNKVNISIEVLQKLIKPNGNLPNFGDNDNGFYFSFLNTYSLENDIEQYYYNFFEKKINIECNLLGIIFKKKFLNTCTSNKYNNEKITTDNYFLLNKNNIYLFFNAKEITHHRHEDILNVELNINGKDIFVDSGTYSYNKNTSDRRYFRSSEAHNTISYKTIKQASQIGTFRWINSVQGKIETKDFNNFIKISAYLIRNKIPFHRRDIIIDFQNKIVTISDKSSLDESYNINWYMNEDVYVNYKDKIIVNGGLSKQNYNLFKNIKQYSTRYGELYTIVNLKLEKINKDNNINLIIMYDN